MKNFTNNIRSKYIDFVIIFFIFTLVLCIRFLFTELGDLDELWNYQFSRRIAYGQVPYKDYFLITTPLAPQINSLFLSVFGDELYVMRVVGSIFASINALVIYIIFFLSTQNKNASFLVSCFFMGLVFLYPQNNYSWLAILFLSLALLFETIKIIFKNGIFYYEIIIGFFLGLSFVTKQNIGIFGFLFSVLFLFYNTFCENRSKNFKIYQFFFRGISKLLGFLFVIFLEIGFLIHNNAFNDFFDQTIIGLSAFSKEVAISYFEFLKGSPFFGTLVALIFPLAIIAIFFASLFKDFFATANKLQILFCLYAMASFSAIYPLADKSHLLFSLSLSGLPILFFFKKRKIISAKKNKLDSLYLIIFVSFFLLLNIALKPTNSVKNHRINHYKFIPISAKNINSITELGKYINNFKKNGSNVNFLNFRSVFYLIPLNIFSYKSDTMFKGNMGSSGEMLILGKIKEEENIVIIIRGKNMSINRQESLVFENFVKKTMRYIETIQGFDVYKK